MLSTGVFTIGGGAIFKNGNPGKSFLGGDATVTGTSTSMPEPASLLMLGLGLAGGLGLRKKTKRLGRWIDGREDLAAVFFLAHRSNSLFVAQGGDGVDLDGASRGDDAGGTGHGEQERGDAYKG